jgi:pantoate kinase
MSSARSSPSTTRADEFPTVQGAALYKKSRVATPPMGRRTGRGETRRARAFAPGHVTGYFSPDLGVRDPRGRGSVGAGLVLDAGVVAEAAWSPDRATRVIVSSPEGASLPISTDVAQRLSAVAGGRLEVRISHALPIGQGFGMSAAGALATGLAVARVVGRTRRDAIEVAHLAELFGGGGLGGVAAILGGGLEWRARPGIPPFGRVVHRPSRMVVFLGVTGASIDSPRLLRDAAALDRIRFAAQQVEPHRSGPPSLGEFLDASEKFTDMLGLGGPAVQTAVRELRGSGVRVAQAMFGRSFFAVAPTPRARRALVRALEARGLRAVEVPVASTGARSEQSLLSRGRVGATS